MVTKAKWTILTYIAAHNNLQQMGDRSLNQIIGVGSTRDVMHGILFDGPQGATRCVIGGPGKVLQQDQLQDYDSGDPARLIETAQWMFKQYPAERYGLILWSHGSGWQPAEIRSVAGQVRGDTQVDDAESAYRSQMPGSLVLFRSSLAELVKPASDAERAILFDDGTGQSLDTIELGNVTREIQQIIDQPLDFLGMDACLMATIEVAYQLHPWVRYMVASEELVPGTSWPYDVVFDTLRTQPDLAARDLAALVVDEYLQYYEHYPPNLGGGDVTKIALDLSKVEELASSMQELGQALQANMATVLPELAQAQDATYQVETLAGRRDPNKFNYHLWDILAVADLLATNCSQERVRLAAAQAANAFKTSGLVVRAGHRGSWFNDIGGLSVYWIAPKMKQRRHISDAYPAVSFAADTHWHEMLAAYRYQ